MNKQAILIASPGTSVPDIQNSALTCIKRTISVQFPGCEIREAFTSTRIIERLKEVSGMEVDSVNQALEKAAAEGVRRLAVLPLHLTYGREYAKLVSAFQEQERLFAQAWLGTPLLSGEADVAAVAKAVVQRTAAFDDGRTAACLVGHGSGELRAADAEDCYTRVQKKLAQAGYGNYFVGVLKGKPSLEELRSFLQKNSKYQRVVLLPLMVEAGSHARWDIAGEQEASWKRVLEREGYETVCILEGLGQLGQVQKLYVEHVRFQRRGVEWRKY